jgi:RNA polymerase sigma factor (sigma-70 family)
MGPTNSPATRQVPTASQIVPAHPPASTHAFWNNRSRSSAMATPLAHPRKALPDAELARLAGAGDGEAFAELYDRHEVRVYGFCMRLLCSPHDAAEATQDTFVRLLGRLPAIEGRELNFVAYTLATARNACYDMIGSRRRVEPVAESPEPTGPREGEVERDPERRALLQATREQVKAANAALPERQREVLALREVEGLSYEEIGELMGMNRNAVAQLISRARIKLGDLLRGGALASVSATSPECERALGLLAELQDGEEEEDEPLEWVRGHLASCETCRVSRETMEEAGVSYRALGPIAIAAWLRHATIARAAEAVGADWSHLSGDPQGAEPSDPFPAARRRRAAVLVGALLCAIIVLGAATDIGRENHPAVRTLTLLSPPAKPAATTGLPLHRATIPSHRGSRAPRLAGTSDTSTAPIAPTVTAHRTRAAPIYTEHRHARRRRRSSRHRAAPVSVAPPPASTPTQPAPAPTTTTPPAQTTPTSTTPPASTETTTTTHPEEPPSDNTPGRPSEPAGGGGLVP